jgi:hypothetical protein
MRAIPLMLILIMMVVSENAARELALSTHSGVDGSLMASNYSVVPGGWYPLLMAHTCHRDGSESGLRRTPALRLVGLRVDCTVPPLADADSCRLPPPPPSSGRQPGGRRYPSVRSNFRALGNFRSFLDWVSPNQEENSQLALTPEAAIAAFCILALALFEPHPPFP